MNQSERTKLVAKAGKYVKAKMDNTKNGDRDKFIKDASKLYRVSYESLKMILK